MTIACVSLPRFALALELAARPDLRGLPVVIGGQAHQRGAVVACSPEAEASGIAPGIALRRALALCRDAVFLPANPARDEQAAARFLDALMGASPAVEPVEPGCAFVDARGVAPASLAAAVGRALGLTPRAGAAPGKFAARLAALRSEPPRFLTVQPQGVAAFLAPLPVAHLPLPAGALRRLGLFGVRTLGEFAALPPGAVQAQFGPAGRAAWELASGMDRDPLRPVLPAPRLTERLAFDFPTASLGALTLGVQRLLAQAFRRPLLRGRVVRQVSLALLCEGDQSVTHRLTLQEATAQQPRILLSIRSYLERTELPAAVEELRLTLEGLTGERGRQGTLFVDRGRLQAQIDEAARRLIARYGRSPLFTVAEVEPWSRLPERRMALVEYSP